jgi:hypothetical protein
MRTIGANGDRLIPPSVSGDITVAQQAISLFGAVAILLAFALSQIGVWRPSGIPYILLNFIGSALLAMVALRQGQAGFLLLEGAWALISLASLVRIVSQGAGSS